MIRKEVDFYKEQLNKDPSSYRTFPLEARDDRELANYALDKSPFNMWYISERLKNDKTYAMEKLAAYPTFHLNKLGEKLQSDKEMVLFAMKRNQTFDLRDLEHVCKHFINDKEVMEKAMEKMKENPLLVPGEVQIGRAMVVNYQAKASYQGKEAAIELVSKEPEMYRLLSTELKQDPKVALAAINEDHSLIREVPKELQNDNFYTGAAITIPGVENELPLEMKATVMKMAGIPEKPKKSFDEVVKWAKEQKAAMSKGKDSVEHNQPELGDR